jgi:long-chain-fatty-acid--[acyl-carrier-protein] ligase
VLALASRKIEYKEDEEPFSVDLSKWKTPLSSGIAEFAAGKTIPEAFLNICRKNAHQMCMGDDRLGALTYGELKLRSIILANYIKKLPGESVGILLPASVGAFLCIMACELAGKVPVMINWTVGPRHLETVLELSKIKTVLSSWAFIDRLEGVEFNGLEDQMVMLEDIRRDITLTDKIKGKLLSKKSNEAILSSLNPKGASEDDTAVLLFTSGTENNPKGVPLTHKNILNNQRPVITEEKIQKNDVLFGILPPFHSFGFTVATLLPVLAGVRVAFYPKPTDGAKLADRFEKWGITIMCGAPTFIKSMMRMATPDQLKTMRLCVSGAEKAPPEMFEMVKKLSNGMVIEGYGITECSPVITMNRPDRKKKGVGQPLPGVELAIVHPETFERMKPNEQGLILARGDTIFNGYLNPGIEPPFHEMDGVRWYKTGDLGSLDEDNYLTISGRQKRFVKIGGEMVSLSAVEDGLLGIGHKKHWPISEEGPCLAVIAIEESGERTRLVLFTSFLLDLDEANKAIREAGFSNLVRLSQVNHVKEIPIMGTGKVNYRALEKLHT